MLLETLSKLSCPPMCEVSYAVAIMSGRCESRKSYASKHLVHELEHFEITKFSEKLALVTGSGL